MSRQHPRPEQIAALTRGQSLPLSPLPETTLRVVADTLVKAWTDLAAEHAGILCRGDEAEVSCLLVSRLNALLDEDACWEMLIRGVSRGRESLSYDGRHLEKRPDVSLHLTNRSFDFPLVAECKLIDRSRKKTVHLYCRDGLTRFVTGDYGWMSAEAFMLAYVRDNCTIADTLHPHLAAETTCNTLNLPQPFLGAADLAHSRHDRPFRYLSSADKPGPIVLWHLWLPAA